MSNFGSHTGAVTVDDDRDDFISLYLAIPSKKASNDQFSFIYFGSIRLKVFTLFPLVLIFLDLVFGCKQFTFLLMPAVSSFINISQWFYYFRLTINITISYKLHSLPTAEICTSVLI